MSIFQSKELSTCYHDVGPGDVVIGEVTAAHLNTARLIDLLQRGVTCIPSPLSQLLSRSKVAQVEILGQFMLPLTMAVKRRKQLMDAINIYNQAGVGAVVTKEEHMHCGHGVRRWNHIETVYSYRGLDNQGYPFVIQPLAENFIDVRVIMVGDYMEGYTRYNPDSFRGNLSAGGRCAPHMLTADQERFCREIVDRAQFPYAHLDLQIMADGRLHILEIALNGGIQGSRLDRADLEKRKARRLLQLAEIFSQSLPKSPSMHTEKMLLKEELKRD